MACYGMAYRTAIHTWHVMAFIAGSIVGLGLEIYAWQSMICYDITLDGMIYIEPYHGMSGMCRMA